MEEIVSKTAYEKEVRNYSKDFGGFFNAHAHGDRAFTRRDEFYVDIGRSKDEIERLSLKDKQGLVWALHTGRAFSKDSLLERMSCLLEDSIKYGTRRIDSCIDVTYNTGLKSFEIAKTLKKKYKDKIDFRLGAYNVSGFKDSDPERSEIFEQACKEADFIVALAEKDRGEEHIGEKQHNIYMLNLGLKFNVPVHFHVGQANTPKDRGAEVLFECMDWMYNLDKRLDSKSFPKNMLVHDISASCYSKKDFEKHCNQLLKYNLGVICCPTAGISMRQESKYKSRIHNSLARVWDFALRKIPVFLGTDNINDVFVPSSTPDMYDEIFTFSNSLRGYDERILAKIACGKELDDFDRGKIKEMIF
ncbi:hypothetical protein KAJ87_02420 [Candidatus Pacearchaeota archaeon]|nr:hypothetical protein [Candidatus Pacearchaeota archaeon]